MERPACTAVGAGERHRIFNVDETPDPARWIYKVPSKLPAIGARSRPALFPYLSRARPDLVVI